MNRPITEYFFATILFVIASSATSAQIIPNQTLSNFKIDLLSIYDVGTRPLSGTVSDYMDTQGAIVITNGKYDYAILGHGFFRIKNHINGDIYYTRCGKFIKRDNTFFSESEDEIILSAEDFDKLCNTNTKTTTISLFYPDDDQEILVLDNKYWTSEDKCKIVESEVVFNALEENPIDLQRLLLQIKSNISINKGYNETARDDCIYLLNGLLLFLKESNTSTRDNKLVPEYINKLTIAMDKL